MSREPARQGRQVVLECCAMVFLFSHSSVIWHPYIPHLLSNPTQNLAQKPLQKALDLASLAQTIVAL